MAYRRGAELLFQVLTEREEKASIAIGSNESFSGWAKTFTDPRLCAAIVDRLTFHGTIIETGTTWDRFFYLAWQTTDSKAVLYRVDAGQELADGSFAWAKDVETSAAGYFSDLTVTEEGARRGGLQLRRLPGADAGTVLVPGRGGAGLRGVHHLREDAFGPPSRRSTRTSSSRPSLWPARSLSTPYCPAIAPTGS
ncbi:hypothetical protein HEB94_000145 [Actinopolymorpha pittospori]|uniref:IstB-like ATP-binding domain-containing protein n=1 Tax=Actinopolymorpha pittospori TaxID=648752 RepID=A0A927MU23_9ACTN|nr:hypothetical protein [Actinopolymorpha pittospori]